MMVKVCGVTNAEDALAAVEAGVSALGFNFWPDSPRYITAEAAAAIAAVLPASVIRVGVFVDETAANIEAIAAAARVQVAQLHGECERLDALPVWRALSVGPGFAPEELDRHSAEAFLLDAPAGAKFGGTGRPFDWDRVRGLTHRIILAGGLDATNVAAAIATVRPWGVDACSRLESAPGRKDHQRMRAFIEAARSKDT